MYGSAVSVAAVGNSVDLDGDSGFFEEDSVVANAEAKEAFELAGQRLDAARSGFGVTVNGFENRHGDVLRDGSDLSRDLRLEVDLLHTLQSPLEPARICSMVKPRPATTRSKGMPWPPLRKYSSAARRARRSSPVNSSSASSSTMTFEQRAHRDELGGRQLIEQRVSLLAFHLRIEGHG